MPVKTVFAGTERAWEIIKFYLNPVGRLYLIYQFCTRLVFTYIITNTFLFGLRFLEDLNELVCEEGLPPMCVRMAWGGQENL